MLILAVPLAHAGALALPAPPPTRPVDGLLSTYTQHSESLETLRERTVPAAVAVTGALAIAEEARTWNDGVIMASLVGVALELEAQEVVQERLDELPARYRQDLQAWMADFATPVPELRHERSFVVENVFTESPLLWPVGVATLSLIDELQPVLHLPGPERRQALRRWEAAIPTTAWTCWGRRANWTRRQHARLLSTWDQDRAVADAGWVCLASATSATTCGQTLSP